MSDQHTNRDPPNEDRTAKTLAEKVNQIQKQARQKASRYAETSY